MPNVAQTKVLAREAFLVGFLKKAAAEPTSWQPEPIPEDLPQYRPPLAIYTDTRSDGVLPFRRFWYMASNAMEREAVRDGISRDELLRRYTKRMQGHTPVPVDKASLQAAASRAGAQLKSSRSNRLLAGAERMASAVGSGVRQPFWTSPIYRPYARNTREIHNVHVGSPEFAKNHEVGHVVDPFFVDAEARNSPMIPYEERVGGSYEGEIPAMVVELATAMRNGFDPSLLKQQVGQPWAYDYIKKHGSQLPKASTPATERSAEDTAAIENWVRTLRGKPSWANLDSPLQTMYRQWLSDITKRYGLRQFRKPTQAASVNSPEYRLMEKVKNTPARQKQRYLDMHNPAPITP